MNIVVLRSTELEIMIAKLAELGIDTRPAVDEDGHPVQAECRVGWCVTPHFTTYLGDVVCTVALTDDQFTRLPEYLEDPIFVCDWRPDVLLEDDTPLPWPAYLIDDGEGGLMEYRAGKIAV